MIVHDFTKTDSIAKRFHNAMMADRLARIEFVLSVLKRTSRRLREYVDDGELDAFCAYLFGRMVAPTTNESILVMQSLGIRGLDHIAAELVKYGSFIRVHTRDVLTMHDLIRRMIDLQVMTFSTICAQPEFSSFVEAAARRAFEIQDRVCGCRDVIKSLVHLRFAGQGLALARLCLKTGAEITPHEQPVSPHNTKEKS